MNPTSSLAFRQDEFPFEDSATLTGGRRIRLRWIRPSDAPLLREGFERLSLESRLTRFFRVLPELPDAVVQYFTELDGFDHVAVVATSMPGDGPERGFGVGRFVRRAADPTSAELAITVADELQGQGLGRRLTWILAVAARERGVETFEMSVLSTNMRVHALLHRLGAERCRADRDVVEYEISTSKVADAGPGPTDVARPRRRRRWSTWASAAAGRP